MKSVIILWILYTSPQGWVSESEPLEGFYGNKAHNNCVRAGERLLAQFKKQHPDKEQPSYVCFEQNMPEVNIFGSTSRIDSDPLAHEAASKIDL